MRSRVARLPTTIWAALLIIFPLIALSETTSGTAFEYVPITAIVLGFLASASRLPAGAIGNVGLAVGSSVALYAALFLLFAPPYQPDKLALFLMVVLLFGVMLGICFQEKMFLDRLPFAFLVVGGIAIILLALNPSAHQEGRMTYAGGNPIWMGRSLSLAGVAAIWFILRGQRWAWGVLLLSFGAIAITGSRGPFLSLAAALGFGLVFLKQEGRAPVILAGGYIILVLAALQVGFGIIPQLRAFDFGSITGREFLYSHAIDIIAVVPQGIGVGNFRFDHFVYPHNLVLEFLAEWGLTLGGVLVGLILWGGIRLLQMPAEFDILKLAFVTEFINSQFSGDVTTPRMLYALVFVGLLPIGHQRSKRRAMVARHHWAPTTPS